MRERSLEVGGYATAAWFDDDSNVDDDVGLGGRLGIVFLPHHELEFSVDFINTDDNMGLGLDVDLSTFKMGYVFNLLPKAGISPLLMVGAGWQRVQVVDDYAYSYYELVDETDPLAYAGAGVRFFLGPVLNIRVDAQAVAVYPDGDSQDRLVDKVINVGVGWVLGGH